MTIEIARLEEFLDELASHVTTNGIVTFSAEYETQKWDVKRSKGGLTFGTSKKQDMKFRGIFANTLVGSGRLGLVLRTFTDKFDELSGLPIKEIRGYLVALDGQHVRWEKLAPDEIAEASGRDEAGKIIPAEKAVVYC